MIKPELIKSSRRPFKRHIRLTVGDSFRPGQLLLMGHIEVLSSEIYEAETVLIVTVIIPPLLGVLDAHARLLGIVLLEREQKASWF